MPTAGLPLPRELKLRDQPVAPQPTVVVWENEAVPWLAAPLALLSEAGQLTVAIEDSSMVRPTLGVDESCRIQRGDDGLRLAAPTVWGALYGLTTLAQLAHVGLLDRLEQMVDSPRFVWRGVLIDVARHFLSMESLHRIVDGLAELKMNVLHLHLSDDQAVRFYSHRYPRLASPEHYSHEELRSLVDYAAQRGVRLVPELDVPGHVTHWLTAYPQWGTRQVAATQRFGVHEACLDPTSEATFTAVCELFAELAQVFPDDYVHIGGDEVNGRWWREDAEIQNFMRSHDLADTQALQTHFNRRLVTALQQLGKQVVAWDEVLHDDMPQLVVQNWRGATTRDRALEKSLACIVSSGYYLDLNFPSDMHYAFDPTAPQSVLVELENSWRQDPRLEHVAEGMAWTDQWRTGATNSVPDPEQVLGGEACLWAELVDEHTWPMRLWSRLPAIAERLWSAATVTDAHDLYRRQEMLGQRSPFDVQQQQERRLTALRLDTEQVAAAAWLEPVKWYARLLGAQALEARLAGSEMPQARPYDTATPLNRVVDFLNPESLPTRRLVDAQSIADAAEAWRRLDPQAWPGDCRGAIDALQRLGQWVAGYRQQSESFSRESSRESLDNLYGPHGEYVVAPVLAVLRWIDHVD